MAVEGIELIEELKFKKDRLGRPFISAYQEKLKILEDLQKNKYINPKTGKKFTPKEWLDASATTRSKYRDPKSFLQKKKEYQKKYMAEKKKDPAYKKEFLKKKKDEYFKTVDKKYKVDKGAGKAILQIQDNKLLGYLLTAANKQKKNLKGDAKSQFEEVTKNKKFVGVKDNKTGITYHHARYKGTLGVNDRLITDHPQFNKIKDLTKIADGFKRSLPNATIASYFAKYNRVPTNAELYNFLSKDPDLVSKYSAQAMASNPLELHHRLGVEVAPDKSLQLTPRVKNNTAGVIVEEFKKGNLSKSEVEKQLKKINVRVKLPGTKSYIGAKDVAPTQAVGAAKREVSKMFLERIKNDPSIIEKISKTYNIMPLEDSRKLDKAIKCADGCFVKVINKNPKKLADLLASGQITTADNLPRPNEAKLADTFKETNLRWNNDVGAFETKNGDIASQSDIKKYAADNPMEVKVGEEPVKAATNKSVLANVGKAMARIGAPLPTAVLDSYFIGQQVKEGKGTAEIASNPLNWLGLATMEPLTKISGVAEGSGTLNKALRLGLNPATIRGISRFAGLPGLAVSTAMTAYDQYQKYKDGEGFIFNLLNQKGTE